MPSETIIEGKLDTETNKRADEYQDRSSRREPLDYVGPCDLRPDETE